MDREGCGEGLATDHVMLYENDWTPLSCGVSFAFYVSYFTVITFLRLLVTLAQLQMWRDREHRINKTRAASAGKRRRLPVVPFLSFVSFFAMLLFTILTSTNVATGANGGPAFLLGLLYFPVAVQAFILMSRVGRFGKRLIPKTKTQMQERAIVLNTTTTFLRVIQLNLILATLIASTSYFAGLFSPVYITFQLGATSYATQDIICGVGLLYQYQRIIDVIMGAQNSSQQEGVGGTSGSEQRQKLKHVLARLRLHQVIWGFMAPSVSAVWLVTVTRVTLPYYWWVLATVHIGFMVQLTFPWLHRMVMIFFTVELVLTACLTLANIPKEWVNRLLKCCLRKQNTLSDETDALTPGLATSGGSVLRIGSGT
jgi:hypothetical protein